MITLRHYLDLPRSVHILCAGTLINRVGGLLVIFLTLYVHDELGFDEAFATMAMGAFGLGSMSAALVGGHFADAIGRRPVMILALLGGAMVLVLFPFFRSKPAIVLGVLAFSFLTDMYRPAAQAMIGDLVEPVRRPEAFGLMYLAINLGFSVAPPLGGWLAGYSYRLLFWLDAATAVVYAGIILLFIRETLPTVSHSDTHDDRTVSPVSSLDVLRRIVADHAFVIFCGATLLISMVYVQGLSTLPLFLGDIGFSPRQYGLIMMTNGIMIVALQLPVVSIVGRLNRAAVISTAAICVGVGFGITGLGASMWFFVITVAIWTLGEIMAAPLNSAIVTDLAPTEMRGRYMGVYTMCYSSANLIGAPIGGKIMSTYGHQRVWAACAITSLVAAGLFLSIHRHIRKPATTTQS